MYLDDLTESINWDSGSGTQDVTVVLYYHLDGSETDEEIYRRAERDACDRNGYLGRLDASMLARETTSYGTFATVTLRVEREY